MGRPFLFAKRPTPQVQAAQVNPGCDAAPSLHQGARHWAAPARRTILNGVKTITVGGCFPSTIPGVSVSERCASLGDETIHGGRPSGLFDGLTRFRL